MVALPKIAELVDRLGVDGLLSQLTDDEQRLVLDDWDLWRLPYQDLPQGAWRRWLLLTGRGTGKTHTGARWICELARDKRALVGGEIGLIGRTYSDVRHTMIEGSSGILAVSPRGWRPSWSPGTSTLTWPNGVRARAYSADEPDGIRGKNFALVWGDEVSFWPNAADVWTRHVQPALRIGRSQAILTTTPKRRHSSNVLKKLIDMPGTVVTAASMYDNPFLSSETRAEIEALYAGTEAGAAEIEGRLLDDVPGALWRHDWIERSRCVNPPDLKRVVIGVDPAVSYGEDSDETGIVAVGQGYDDRLYVLADRTVKASPSGWAAVVRDLFDEVEADEVACEVNQGGDMVEATLRAELPRAMITQVRATRGKRVRAEPIAAAYERGTVSHCGVFAELETQLISWEPGSGNSSPDRLDALVWAATHLTQGPQPLPWGAYL